MKNKCKNRGVFPNTECKKRYKCKKEAKKVDIFEKRKKLIFKRNCCNIYAYEITPYCFVLPGSMITAWKRKTINRINKLKIQ